MNTNASSQVVVNASHIIGYVLLFVVAILFLLKADTFIKDKAIDDCAKISTFEKTIVDQGSKVSYPVVEVYKDCLAKKGIK